MIDLMLTPEAEKLLADARAAMDSAKDQQAAAEETRRAAVLEAVDLGASQSEIARVLGVSQGRVAQIIQNRR